MTCNCTSRRELVYCVQYKGRVAALLPIVWIQLSDFGTRHLLSHSPMPTTTTKQTASTV